MGIRRTKKMIKKVAKTTGGAVGGAVLRGGCAALEVALAPIYIASEAICGAVNGAAIVNGDPTMSERINEAADRIKERKR